MKKPTTHKKTVWTIDAGNSSPRELGEYVAQTILLAKDFATHQNPITIELPPKSIELPYGIIANPFITLDGTALGHKKTIAEIDRLKAINAELREAATIVAKICQVPAPGPHFRWDDEYYEAFNKLDAILAKHAPESPQEAEKE